MKKQRHTMQVLPSAKNTAAAVARHYFLVLQQSTYFEFAVVAASIEAFFLDAVTGDMPLLEKVVGINSGNEQIWRRCLGNDMIQ